MQNNTIFFFNKSSPRPIQSISCNVRHNICLSVHAWTSRFPVDWRLLVKDCITNIGIPLNACVYVPSSGNRNRVDWRLLVEEHITKITKPRNLFLECSDNFGLDFFKVFVWIGWFPKTTNSVLTNKPSVHSGGVSRGGCVAVAIGVGDMWQVKNYKHIKKRKLFSINLLELFEIIATIRTRWWIQILPYTGFFNFSPKLCQCFPSTF